MYLRRLRSIMDEYTNGKLAGVSLFHSIRSFVCLFVMLLFIHLPIFLCSLARLLTLSLLPSHARSLTHSLTHSLTQCLLPLDQMYPSPE